MGSVDDIKRAQLEFEAALSTGGVHDADTLRAVLQLAGEYQHAGNLRAAQAVLEEALAAYGPWEESEDYEVFRVAVRLGNVLSELNDDEMARAIQERTLRVARRRYGDRESITLICIHNLEITHSKLGHFEKSIALANEEVEARSQTAGPNAESTIVAKVRLGNRYRESGDVAKARRIHEETVDEVSVAFPRTRFQIDTMRVLMEDLVMLKDQSAAAQLMQEIDDLAMDSLDAVDPFRRRLKRMRPLTRWLIWASANRDEQM
jgi:tetratricopeptide (TPR) repeat protein